MTECFREAASLGYASLNQEQEKVLSELLEGKDVFVSLPTGVGKSLCYAAQPRVHEIIMVP